MAISLDASTPAVVDLTGSTSTTITTASFSPPAGCWIAVTFGIETDTGGSAPTITCKDSLSNAYTAGPSNWDALAGGTFQFKNYYATAPGSITVTVTRAVNTGAALLDLVVLVLNGVAASQTGFASASHNGASSTTNTSSITTTVTGSWVIVSNTVDAVQTKFTPVGLTTRHTESSSGDTGATMTGWAVTLTPGATTLGWTVGTTQQWSWAATEFLPGTAAGPQDIPQVNPGPGWLDHFKPGLPKVRPLVPPASPPALSPATGTGSFSLAPLALALQGSQTSPDVPKILPGPTWLDLFKPGIPRPRPWAPPFSWGSVSAAGSFSLAPLAFSASGSVLAVITGTASFKLAPFAFAAKGSQSSPDVPQIQPGPYWLSLFKSVPYKPYPAPPATPSVNAAGSFTLAPLHFSASGSVVSPDSSAGSFTLAPLKFAAQGSQTSPDLPQINPGTTWFALFKQQVPRPYPVPPATPSVNAAGSLTLAPLHFAASGSVISPDTSTGSFTLAPLAFSAKGSQTSPDQPQVTPGPSWLKLFKPWLPRSRPVPPAVQSVNAAGSFALAPLVFAASGTVVSPDSSAGSFALAPLAFTARGSQTSPDLPQIAPGPVWLSLFKRQKPRPVPPAFQGVSGTASLTLGPLAFAASGSVISPDAATGSFTLAPLKFAAQGSQTSPDQPQVNPGSTWLSLFKHRQRPVPPAVQPVTAAGSLTLAPLKFAASGSILGVVTSTGSLALAPLAFIARGSQSSPDVPQVIPGTTWLSWFKHRPRPVVPAVQGVNATGSFALAALAFAGQGSETAGSSGSFSLAPLALALRGSQTSPDVPQIVPGTTWFSLFKHRQRPVPPAAQSVNASGSLALASFAFSASGTVIPVVAVTGSFTLAPLALAARGAQSSPDQPQIIPGPSWFRRFKPGFYKPVPPPPAAQSVGVTGSFTLAPLAFAAIGTVSGGSLIASTGGIALAPLAYTGLASQTSPDQPQVQPGPVWIRLFRPDLHRPLPPLPALQAANATGSLSLASLAFTSAGNQTSPDVPQIFPGSTWLSFFKRRPRPVPPAVQGVNGAGSLTLAPLTFAARGAQSSPDQLQVQPGPSWFRLFKPGLYRPVPPPPAVQGVSASGSFTLAPLAFAAQGSQSGFTSTTGSLALAPVAFAAQGSQTSPDVPSVSPGPSWLRLFRPWVPRRVPPLPARDQVSASGSLTLGSPAFIAHGAQSSPDVPQISPGSTWLGLFKHKPRPVSPATPGVTISGSFSLAPPAFAASGTIASVPAGPVQVAPGPGWLARFKHWQRPLRPDAPPTHVSSAGSLALAPLVISGESVTPPALIRLGVPCFQWVTGTPGQEWTAPVPGPDWVTGQARTRWQPGLPQTRWDVMGAEIRWQADLPWTEWTVGYTAIGLSHLALEYVLIPVSATKAGISYNPVSDVVQFAFMPTPTQVPQVSDWVSGAWDTDTTNILYPYNAKCLVGPGGTIVLGIGTYIIYLKITDNPEIPVLVAGQLQVS